MIKRFLKRFVEYVKKMFQIIFGKEAYGNDSKSLYSGITLYYGALFLAVVSAILTALNIYKHYWFMTGSTTGLIIGFFIAAIVARKEKVSVSQGIMAVLVAFTFSMYCITGQNDGFACLWILLVPIVSMVLLGLRTGFILSAYYQLFLFVVFYSPIWKLINADQVIGGYTDTFRMRFPILYFCSFGVVTILMVQRKELYDKINSQALTDGLTGLYNRACAVKNLPSFDTSGYRNLTVVMLDLNQLKTTNDKLGHEAGDELIIGAANIIKNAFPEDLTFRIGGDEFLVVCNRTDIEENLENMEKACAEWHGKFSETLTISYGHASRHDHPGAHYKELSKLADEEMYTNKAAFYRRAGINRRR